MKLFKLSNEDLSQWKEIVARIEKEFGKEISIDTLKRELKRNSYIYKRPKKSTRSFKSPDYEIKKKSWIFFLKKKGMVKLKFSIMMNQVFR